MGFNKQDEIKRKFGKEKSSLKAFFKIKIFLLLINFLEIKENLTNKCIIPEMILTDWILTLGFKNIPLDHSILLLEGLLLSGWEFLFFVIGEVYRTLFPTFRRLDMGLTLNKLKNSQRSGIFSFGKGSISWNQILTKGIDIFSKKN